MQQQLSFRPYTLDEVSNVTKVPTTVLEWLLKTLPCLKLRTGEDKVTVGLEHMQMLAVFVGNRWRDQGAPNEKVLMVTHFCCYLNIEGMEAEFAKGNTFPCFEPPMLVKLPFPRPKLYHELNLRKLWEEFCARVEAVFPT